MKYAVKFTSQFKKDLKKAKKQGKDIEKILRVIKLLADDKKLPISLHDHELSGDYAGTRECHIEPDWLLVYEKIEETLVLMCYRNGTHSELF